MKNLSSRLGLARVSLLTAGGLSLFPAAARARILAYEGYDYASGSPLGD